MSTEKKPQKQIKKSLESLLLDIDTRSGLRHKCDSILRAMKEGKTSLKYYYASTPPEPPTEDEYQDFEVLRGIGIKCVVCFDGKEHWVEFSWGENEQSSDVKTGQVKHKLSGRAIKSDNKRDTVNRIHEVLRVDGWESFGFDFKRKLWYGCIAGEAHYDAKTRTEIPLSEARALVFGSEKQKPLSIDGFYVVFSGDQSVGIPDVEWKITGGFEFQDSDELGTFKEKLLSAWEYASDTPIFIESFEDRRIQEEKEDSCLNELEPTEDELKVGMMAYADKSEDDFRKEEFIPIFKIEEISIQGINEKPWARPELGVPNGVRIEHCRRATLTDFLKTLPEDIAERALRQVDETSEYYTLHPEDLPAAVAAIGKWDDKDEGYQFWNEVAHGNYDRARELLKVDRVGKWWKYSETGMFMATSINDKGGIHGYGVRTNGEWLDNSNQFHSPWVSVHEYDDLTPANPKEVERMLTEMTEKKYKVGDVVESTWSGNNRTIEELDIEIELCDSDNDCTVSVEGVFLFLNGQWATIIEPAQDSKMEPEADKFPRMMWVGDYIKEMKPRMVDHHVKTHSYPWKTQTQEYRYASDTHPVTGEPAVQGSRPNFKN